MKLHGDKPLLSPLSRHRVLYIGNRTTIQLKNGLDCIQEPLRFLYSANDGISNSSGMDAWLSVLSDGLEIEYVEEKKSLKFPIQNLHYCAAVRLVNMIGYCTNEETSGDENAKEKFLPLDNPMANLPTAQHPPIFVSVFRKTKSLNVLECYAFICTTTEAANSFVRFCFHAYADNMYLNMRHENGAQIGKAGELSADESPRSNDDAKDKDGGSNFNQFNQNYSPCSKSENENSCVPNGTVANRSKANRHWSNVKSKYYNKLQKKTLDSDAQTACLKIPEPEKKPQRSSSPCSTDTKSDSSKNYFWKNRRRRSRSELNLNTIEKAKTSFVPVRTPFPVPLQPVAKRDTSNRICYMPPPHHRFQHPESIYGSFSSSIPLVMPNVCSVFEVSHVIPQFLKLAPPPVYSVVQTAPLILCPPPIHQVVVTPAVFHDTENVNVHKSMYSIPQLQNSFEEPLYASNNRLGSLPYLANAFGSSSSNTFVQYASISNIYDGNERQIGRDRAKSGGSNRPKENYSPFHYHPRLRENAVYPKGAFGLHEGNEKAFIYASMQAKNNNANGVLLNDFVDDDERREEVKRSSKKIELDYSFGKSRRENGRKKSVEESIRRLNISDCDDELEI